MSKGLKRQIVAALLALLISALSMHILRRRLNRQYSLEYHVMVGEFSQMNNAKKKLADIHYGQSVSRALARRVVRSPSCLLSFLSAK